MTDVTTDFDGVKTGLDDIRMGFDVVNVDTGVEVTKDADEGKTVVSVFAFFQVLLTAADTEADAG